MTTKTRKIADVFSTDLLHALAYQAAPGIHTFGTGGCGHPARGCGAWCAACLDRELLRRGVDVERLQPTRWERDRDGRVHRRVT